MFLTLLRHATATTCAEVEEDGERPLASKGLEQLARVGNFCREYHVVPNLVLTSPVLRARQTAECMTKLGDWPMPITESWLTCGMQPETAIEQLRVYEEYPSVAIVGHEPDLSKLVACFLGAYGEAFKIRKSCLVGLQVSSLRESGATLHYFLPCRFMPKHHT